MRSTTQSIPWWQPEVGAEEREALARVVDSNYLNEGDVTAQFERQCAGLVGARHAVATTSGTSAIFLALKGLGIGVGDEVIIPDVTFIATANAVTLTGATPVLVDVDAEALMLDPSALERAITPRTRAIVPVHVSGRAAAIERIVDIATAHGLAVVEDAAEAFLSRHAGRCLGTFGTAGCFSFSPNKTVTTGQGGLVVTADEALAVRLRELKDQGRPVRGTGGNDVHDVVGYNFKLTNMQAAVGIAQLGKLEARVARLQDLYRWYESGLAGVPRIRLFPFDVEGGESPQWVDALAENRDGLVEHLLRHGMHCRPFWFPIHTQRPYSRPDHDFPVSSRLGPSAVWLPSAFQLGEPDVRLVCDEIRRVLFKLIVNALPILSIVMPVRNEGLNLRIMLKILTALLDVPHEVLVVVDKHDDASVPVVEAISPHYARLTLVHNTRGVGILNALRAGVSAAQGRYILIFAADEVGPVLAIDDMIALMDEGCEFVSCTRYAHGGRRLGGSWIGGVLSRLANRLFRWLSGSRLTDATTGIKMFTRDVFDRLSLEARPVGWAVAFEMAIKAQIEGLRLGEVPIVSIDRLYGGKSTFRLGPWTVEYFRWFLWGVKELRKNHRRGAEVLVRVPAATALGGKVAM